MQCIAGGSVALDLQRYSVCVCMSVPEGTEYLRMCVVYQEEECFSDLRPLLCAGLLRLKKRSEHGEMSSGYVCGL